MGSKLEGQDSLTVFAEAQMMENEKAGSTLRTSQAVPHPSTNRALCRLTSEVERDPVHSTRYGRQRTLSAPIAHVACKCCWIRTFSFHFDSKAGFQLGPTASNAASEKELRAASGSQRQALQSNEQRPRPAPEWPQAVKMCVFRWFKQVA